MGGNALQYVPTGRKNAKEYRFIMLRVIDKLEYIFPLAQSAIVKNFSDKNDFGDGDIVINQDRLPGDWIRQVQVAFEPGEIVINRLGGTPLVYTRADVEQPNSDLAKQNIVPDVSPESSCVSFDFGGFQIDLIPTPGEYYNSTLNYYAYNDLGNFIGRVASKAGFRFGWQGLVKVLMDGSNKIAHVQIATDMSKMLKLLGYDPEVWERGFDTREDIYTYASSTKFFHRSLFALENLNNDNRTRNKKRSTYMGFIDWIADKPELDRYDWYPYTGHTDVCEERDIEQASWMLEAGKLFPGLNQTVESIMRNYKLGRATKDRFNSVLVSNSTGYKGKQLGNFMQYCQNKYPSFNGLVSWNDWINEIGDCQLDGFINDNLKAFDVLAPDEQAKYTRPRKDDKIIHPLDPKFYAEAVAYMRSIGASANLSD